MKSALAGLALLLAAGVAAVSLAAEGLWLTDGGRSHVEVRPCGDKLYGKIAWLGEWTDENGSPKLDRTTRMNLCAPGRPSGSSC